ncbi:MAG: NifB/NifX family molybdenum-iron cluster-binding protein [Oscillochloridaceae bacterium]|nr:NifB/NifX family molybdenum-iron cluster-binding protein [Chloroflexaceae bacterium]MDW8392319.1 NifB/NifX family molybdenum-iron cluster-binding protein [Oscillochloridaceae bacterium]
MNIALVSNDGTRISRHFGRAQSYVVVTIAEGREVAREIRAKPARHGHSQHVLGLDEVGERQHGHDHDAILAPIADCAVVIANGIGAPMSQRVRQAGLQLICTPILSVDEAIAAFLAGTLDDHPELVH